MLSRVMGGNIDKKYSVFLETTALSPLLHLHLHLCLCICISPLRSLPPPLSLSLSLSPSLFLSLSSPPPSLSSMTRVARILRDKLRRRFAPVVLLRSGKHQPPQSQYAADHTSSTSLFPPFVFFDTQHPLRLFHPRIAYNPARCSRIPVASGARPFSRFGGPSKQPVSRPLRREFRIQSSSQSTYLQQSSLSSWAVVVLAGLISGLVFYTTSPSNVERLEEKDSADSRNLLKGQSNENRHNMAVESLPGRPGTLTPAEEEKLRELWIATLQVFGILDAQEAAEPANGTAKTDAKKSKKKRMSLFRRGHKDEDTSSTTSTESGSRVPSGSGDSDDKYGQTKEFQEALANLSPEAIRAAFWSMVKHDHPDGLLLRFLRARKWDVEKALVMMVSTMRWRSGEMHVDDDIMLNGELAAVLDANGTDPEKKKAGNDFMSQMRMGKSFLHGLDKEGRPMCFVRVRFHKQGEQAEEALERYTVFVIESARLLLAPPVDTAVRTFISRNELWLILFQCVVFDMTGFSMANMVRSR